MHYIALGSDLDKTDIALFHCFYNCLPSRSRSSPLTPFIHQDDISLLPQCINHRLRLLFVLVETRIFATDCLLSNYDFIAGPKRAKARVDGVMGVVDSRLQQAQQKYREISKKSKTDENCRTDQQACAAEVVKDTSLSTEEKKEMLAQCNEESETNACVERPVEACGKTIDARGDPKLTQQFNDWQKRLLKPWLAFATTSTECNRVCFQYSSLFARFASGG